MNDEMATTGNGNNLSVFCDYYAFVILAYFVIFEIKFIQTYIFLEQFFYYYFVIMSPTFITVNINLSIFL